MTDPPNPLGNLHAARADLRQQLMDLDVLIKSAERRRGALQNAVQQLDELIDQLSGAPVVGDAGVDAAFVGLDGVRRIVELKRVRSNAFAPSAGSESPSARQAILQLLASQDRDFEASEVVEGVRELGSKADPATTRSLLSKMAKSEEIQRPRRGLYRASTKTAQLPSKTGRYVGRKGRHYWMPVIQEEVTPEQLRAIEEGAPSPNELREIGAPPLTDEDYRQWNREAEQTRLEDQADREESP